jgi:phospholipase C
MNVKAALAASVPELTPGYWGMEWSGGSRLICCFSEATLPVLSTFAKQYAVCDNWFSSVSGPTILNRMFAHGATSLGSVVHDPVIQLCPEASQLQSLA